MIDPQTMYTQTPGAYHMGMGYAHLGGVQDQFGGTMFGMGTLGTGLGVRARGLIGYAPTVLTAMAGLSQIGVSGFGIGAMGGAMATAGGLPLVMAGAAVSAFQRGMDSTIYGGQALSNVFRDRDAGGRLGLGASRDAALQYARVFRDLSTSADMLTNDAELKSIMSKMTDMQLLSTSRSASDMSGRFKKMVETMRDISIDMGTTLDGVIPIFQRHLQMGFLDPQHIQRVAGRGRAVSGVGLAMSQDDVQGFGMSQAGAAGARGGRRDYAAEQAQDALGLVSYSMLRNQGLNNFEARLQQAGLGHGVEGAKNFTQSLLESSSSLMDTQMGTALAQFLGRKGATGQYIGGIDAQQLTKLRDALKSGKFNLAAAAAERVSGAEMSFAAHDMAGLRTDIQSGLGMGDTVQVLKHLVEQNVGNDPSAARILLTKLTGQKGKVVDLMLEFINGTTDDITRGYEREVNQLMLRNRFAGEVVAKYSMEATFARANRSIQSNFLSGIYDVGAEFTGALGRYGDNISNQWWQRGALRAWAAIYGVGLGGQFTGISAGARGSDAFRTQLIETLEDAPLLPAAGDPQKGSDEGIEYINQTDLELRDQMMRGTTETGGRAVAGGVGFLAGAAVGAKGGAALGAFIFGLPTGGTAAPIGGAIGGALGAIGGGVLGAWAAMTASDMLQATDRDDIAKRKQDLLDSITSSNSLTPVQKDQKKKYVEQLAREAEFALTLKEGLGTLDSQREKASQRLDSLIHSADMFGDEDFDTTFGPEVDSDFMRGLLERNELHTLRKIGDAVKNPTKFSALLTASTGDNAQFRKYMRKQLGVGEESLDDLSVTQFRELVRSMYKGGAAKRETFGTELVSAVDSSLSLQAQGVRDEQFALFGDTELGAALKDRDYDTFFTLAGDSTKVAAQLGTLGEASRVRAAAFLEAATKAQGNDSKARIAAALAQVESQSTSAAGQALGRRGDTDTLAGVSDVLRDSILAQRGLLKAITDATTAAEQQRMAVETFVKTVTDSLNTIKAQQGNAP